MIKKINQIPIYENLLNSNTSKILNKYNIPKLSYIDTETDILKNSFNFILENSFIAENQNKINISLNQLQSKIKELESIKKDSLYNGINFYKSSLIALKYDLKTNWEFKNKTDLNNIPYIEDTNKYLFVNKQINYKDISIFQILKILFKTHKISSYDYKNSIKRIKNKKPIKNSVKRFINSYLKTLKSHNSKTSLSALKRNSDLRNFEILKVDNQNYKVITKSYYNRYLNIYSKLNPLKLPLLDSKLNKEFQKRFKHNNQINLNTN